MRIGITGVAGFVGRHVLDALAAAQVDEVVGLDSFEEVVHGPGPYPSHVAGFTRPDVRCKVMHGNVCDPIAVELFLEHVDVVIHLAAAVSVSSSLVDPARFVRENEGGTATLWAALQTHPVQLVVNASSMSVYGHGHELVGVQERHDIPRPLNVYGWSKYGAEQLCRICGDLQGIPVTSLRLFNLYGPGQSLRNAETGVVAIWAAAMRRGDTPVLFEDGQQLRDFLYVTDAATVIARAALLRQPGVVNVGTGLATPLQVVADGISRRLDRPRLVPSHTARLGDARHCWADIRLLQHSFGFTPKVTIDDGLDATMAWAQTEALEV